jgi:hypothetical protein
MRFGAVTLAAAVFLGTGPAQAGEWTKRDLSAVAEAGLSAAASTGVLRVANILRLADALLKAGDAPEAREALLTAARLAPGPVGVDVFRGEVIDRLVQAGGAPDAERLISVETAPDAKTFYLCKLGAAKARAGDAAGALRSADEIEALNPTPLDPYVKDGVAYGQGACDTGLSEIGKGFADRGSFDGALRIADSQRDGQAKVEILSEVAQVLCTTKATGAVDRDRGTRIARQAADSARAVVSALPAPGKSFLLRVFINPAAEAIADCEGLAAARAFIASVASDEPNLADRLAPFTDVAPDDAERLIRRAESSLKDGNLSEARADALAAGRAVVAASPSEVDAARNDPVLHGRVTDVLARLGEYDAALAVVINDDADRRMQDDFGILLVAIGRRDRQTVDRLLSTVVDSIRSASDAPNMATGEMEDIARELAIAGYQAEAKQTYNQLLVQVTQTPSDSVMPYLKFELQALSGDYRGAVAAARGLGPLTDHVDPTLTQFKVEFALAMELNRPPTSDEIVAARRAIEPTAPKEEAGPATIALSTIAEDLAKKGDVVGALEVEAEFDSASHDLVANQRDSVLAAIAAAQSKGGDPRGALATIQRMSSPSDQMDPLLELAAIAPERWSSGTVR